MATTKKKLERGPMGRARKAPADDGGARKMDAEFVRGMEAAGAGAISAAGVCFAQASAACPPGPRRDALDYFARLALGFGAAVRTLSDREGVERAAKLAAEFGDRVFRPCGEEAAK